jgi:hypothetical protein
LSLSRIHSPLPLSHRAFFSSLFLSVQPSRAADEESAQCNQERLQRACDAMVEAILSLDIPMYAPPLQLMVSAS